jgi:hypothetical protein
MSQVFIGIDENTSLLYEGSPSMYGHAIWPTPFLSIGCHIGPLSEWNKTNGPANLSNAQMLFREDYFDPVARIRRGRLYYRFGGMNPADWQVQRHPAFGAHPRGDTSYASYGHSSSGLDGYSPKRLVTFCSWVPAASVLGHLRRSVLILGTGDRTSIYTVLDVEHLASGEELITVRTRASLGVLPELLETLIPELHSALVLEQYEKAARAAFRDDADSVVDRCREAASAALNAERSLHDDAAVGKDLSDLANFFGSEKFGARGGRAVLSNAARIIARLHARAKTSERLNNQTAPLSEGDAECALALLGTIYRELGWTHR